MRRTVSDGAGPVRRKVQMTGGSTYTVSIPKEWAEARDVGTGTIVSVYPFEDSLVVYTEEDGGGARTTVNVDTVDFEEIERRIVAAYAAGGDEILIESDTGFDADQRRVANRTIRGLVGLEVAEETDRHLLARSLLDPSEVSLESTIAQMRQIALAMHEDAVAALLADGDEAEELAAFVVDRDDEVDRLFALLSRGFYRVLDDVREMEQFRTTRGEAFAQFRVARQLERVADHAERIARIANRQSSPPAGDLAHRFDVAAADARRVVRIALEGNTGEALIRRDDLVEDIEAHDRAVYESQGDDAYLHGRVLESIRRTAEYGVNVAEALVLRDIAEGR